MMRLHMRAKKTEQPGFILPGVIAFMLAMSIIGTATITIILTNLSVVGNNVRSQQAVNIAEAGLNYYLWHLSHNANDYKDGQTTQTTPDATLGYGPYVHNYIDDNGVTTGTYTLWIKPQGSGSTIVSVRSIGQVAGSNDVRTVQAQIGAASFASYGLVSDTEFWFGSNESANGPVFSNVGVHMDGANTDTVGSANANYTPQSKYGGDGSSHAGVWCNTSVSGCSTRNKTSWSYPQTSVDFNQVSTSLCNMKKTALADYSTTSAVTNCSYVTTNGQASGPAIPRTNAYIPQLATSFSSTKGYLIQLNTNGTYDLYKVNGENDTAASYTAALSTTAVATGITIPPSGVIFTEDNVWVRSNPTFHGRVTIASGRLATGSSTNITIADNVLYSTKDGSDAIGLVAENNVQIAPYAPPSAAGSFSFEVDAAALAQSGSVTWPQYYAGTSTCTKGWVNPSQTLTFYGSVATRLDWTWNYQTGSCGSAVRDTSTGYYISGVEHTATNYDYNLLYAPPPSYPITGSYNILNWREVLVRP